MESETGGDRLAAYATQVGKLVINFQSLELVLRAFLQSQPDAEPLGLAQEKDYYACAVGSVVALCPLTNRDSLQDLIRKYNRIAWLHSGQRLDPKLAEIRDALAHGRNLATMADGSMRSIIYSKPINPDKKTVKVTFNEILDDDWFGEQVIRVGEAVTTVYEALPANASQSSSKRENG